MCIQIQTPQGWELVMIGLVYVDFFFFFYRNDRFFFFFFKERSTWNLDLQYLRKLYPHFIFDFQYFKCKFDIECFLYFNIACPSLILILIQCLTLLKSLKYSKCHFFYPHDSSCVPTKLTLL